MLVRRRASRPRSSGSCAATSPGPAGRSTQKPRAPCAAFAAARGPRAQRQAPRADPDPDDQGRCSRPCRSLRKRRASASAGRSSTQAREARALALFQRGTEVLAKPRHPAWPTPSSSSGEREGEIAPDRRGPDPGLLALLAGDSEYGKPARIQPSYDKQILRDYLETLDWNKEYRRGPTCPIAVVLERVAQRYLEICERITGSRPGRS